MKTHCDVTFHPGWWHKNAGVEFDEKFFFDPEYRIEADVRMRRVLFEKFGAYGIGEENPAPRPILFSDLIASGFLYSQMLGCDIQFAKDNSPVVIPKNIEAEDALLLKAPDLHTDPVWQKIKSQISYLQNRFGAVESAINLMGIQNIALDLRGEELFMDYYDEPEAAHQMLRAATDLSLAIGKRLYGVSNVVSGGVSAIIKQTNPNLYLTSNCSVTMISQKMYEEYLLSYDTELAEAFPDFGIHHCGNNLEKLVEGYLKVPNLKFLEAGAGSNLKLVAEALRKNGRGGITVCVRYAPAKLNSAGFDAIRQETEEAIAAFGSDENLCFSCVGKELDGIAAVLAPSLEELASLKDLLPETKVIINFSAKDEDEAKRAMEIVEKFR